MLLYLFELLFIGPLMRLGLGTRQRTLWMVGQVNCLWRSGHDEHRDALQWNMGSLEWGLSKYDVFFFAFINNFRLILVISLLSLFLILGARFGVPVVSDSVDL